MSLQLIYWLFYFNDYLNAQLLIFVLWANVHGFLSHLSYKPFRDINCFIQTTDSYGLPLDACGHYSTRSAAHFYKIF